MIKSVKIYSLVCLLVATQFACNRNEERRTVDVLSGNVAYQNFVPSARTSYFVLDQNKIRLLDISSPNALAISSTFPFTETSFELVRGNSDTLYIQEASGLHIYVRKTEGTARWEEESVISEILPCDKFNIRFPFLLISSGNAPCSSLSTPTTLRLYNILDLSKPKLLSTTETTDLQRIELVPQANAFYFSTTTGQVNYLSINRDSTITTQNVLNEATLSDFSVDGTKLFTKNRGSIKQYELTNRTTAELVSQIPVSQ